MSNGIDRNCRVKETLSRGSRPRRKPDVTAKLRAGPLPVRMLRHLMSNAECRAVNVVWA